MAELKQKENAPGAIASMVLGIISIATGCLIVGLILGIIGIVQAKKAAAIAATDPDKYNTGGCLKAGKITSIIGIVLGSLAIFYWIIWGLFIGAAASSLYW
jgi:hypothetical protein